MQIKNVRDPNQKEKNEILPKLALMSITTAILTCIFYFTTFFTKDIGESMYLASNFFNMKSIAEHNALVKLFELMYGRDYMLSRLEGLPVSIVASILFNALAGTIYMVKTHEKGIK